MQAQDARQVMSDAVAMAWMHVQISVALSVMSLFASSRYVPQLGIKLHYVCEEGHI